MYDSIGMKSPEYENPKREGRLIVAHSWGKWDGDVTANRHGLVFGDAKNLQELGSGDS